jgi:hypothetical protein
MYAGQLCYANILPLPESHLLIAAYSNTLYIFNLNEGYIIDKVTEHESNIVNIFADSENNIYSIDQDGNLIKYAVSDNTIKKNKKIRIVKDKDNFSISEALFVAKNQQEFDIYFINAVNAKLYRYNHQTSLLLIENC